MAVNCTGSEVSQQSDTDSYETLHGLNFFITKEIFMDKKYITV